MFLFVSSGSEPGEVDGGRFDVGAFAAFEFGEFGQFSVDVHRSMHERETTLEPEIDGLRHQAGMGEQMERVASDHAFETPQDDFLRLLVR